MPASPIVQNFQPNEDYDRGYRDASVSLRDRFAMASLTGLLGCSLASIPRDVGEEWKVAYARRAYEYADAMLEARKK